MKRRGNYFLKNRKKGFFLLLKKDFRPGDTPKRCCQQGPGRRGRTGPSLPLGCARKWGEKGFFSALAVSREGAEAAAQPRNPALQAGPPRPPPLPTHRLGRRLLLVHGQCPGVGGHGRAGGSVAPRLTGSSRNGAGRGDRACAARSHRPGPAGTAAAESAFRERRVPGPQSAV